MPEQYYVHNKYRIFILKNVMISLLINDFALSLHSEFLLLDSFRCMHPLEAHTRPSEMVLFHKEKCKRVKLR